MSFNPEFEVGTGSLHLIDKHLIPSQTQDLESSSNNSNKDNQCLNILKFLLCKSFVANNRVILVELAPKQ